MSHSHNSQSGSVLLYIIIAVALLAALSMMLTRGSQTNESQLTTEQSRIAAQEIIDYGNLVANTIQKMRLRGCTDTQFDFANSAWKNGDLSPVHAVGHNPTAVANCSLFSPSGGQIQPILFPQSYFVTGAAGTLQGSSRMRVMSMKGIGDETSQDLIYNLPLVRPEICMQINTMLGVENMATSPANMTEGSVLDYAGTYNTSASYTDTDSKFSGKLAFAAGSCKYYQVVIVR